jgi:UDP-3-O-[3-hydroxymyristoyl] glucosamine N-acyltransferase
VGGEDRSEGEHQQGGQCGARSELQREPPGIPPRRGGCAGVEAGARIGARTWIGPGAYLGEGVRVGADCRIEANVCCHPRVRLGDRVIVHGGASIGCDGFGYVWLDDHHHRVPQLGDVLIEDDVEIGANSCVDRATLGTTRIGRGSKIDNLVQVGHNCDIGEHVILVSQVGISGSVSVGAGALLAGQVGVADHKRIGAGARVGGATKVTRDLQPGEAVLGMPPRAVARTGASVAGPGAAYPGTGTSAGPGWRDSGRGSGGGG